MCQEDYSKKNKKKLGGYKHITYSERTMIERWYNKDKKKPKEIAGLLNKSDRTVRRELKRGFVITKNTHWIDRNEYSADIAQEKYNYNLKAKGQDLKIGSNIEIANYIEKAIKEEKKSPEVIVIEGNLNISARTIRNYIKNGDILNIESIDMIYHKKYNNKNKEKRIALNAPAEKSIEYRPEVANNRNEYGHWEGDLVIGKRKKGAVLLTLTERMTREEIIMKIPSKHNESVVKALNKLERKLGARFYKKFKTITFDNGSEFKNYKLLEKSCLRKTKRLEIYYAHPYCSGERGTNENNNRMIRRWIPKGTIIDDISDEFIQKVQDWLNNYLRAMFGYKSSNMVLLEL